MEIEEIMVRVDGNDGMMIKRVFLVLVVFWVENN